jgi:hypothetical protein
MHLSIQHFMLEQTYFDAAFIVCIWKNTDEFRYVHMYATKQIKIFAYQTAGDQSIGWKRLFSNF